MTTKVSRKIVHIDEEKCDGCGVCIPSCAEGALQIIDGKAKLVSDVYCDGLGACLGECPQDAISIIEREAEEFDEEAAMNQLHHATEDFPLAEDRLACGCPGSSVQQFEKEEATLPCGCPSASVCHFEDTAATEVEVEDKVHQPSTLGHWPVQLTLVPPTAPFLQDADLLIAADCVPFAYAGFHKNFLKNHALVVACPKLDDFQAHLQKLTDIFTQSSVKSVTVVTMEVPCCAGLVHMVKQAIQQSGKEIPLTERQVRIRGDLTY